MYLGIDFSGGADAWKVRCSRPIVWIATIEDIIAPRLTDLRPVQTPPGNGEPFTKVLALLRAGDFAAAGIDAPFAIPAKHLPPGGHVELLNRVDRLSPDPDPGLLQPEQEVSISRQALELRNQQSSTSELALPQRAVELHALVAFAAFSLCELCQPMRSV
jgi:hypothetical protein